MTNNAHRQVLTLKFIIIIITVNVEMVKENQDTQTYM